MPVATATSAEGRAALPVSTAYRGASEHRGQELRVAVHDLDLADHLSIVADRHVSVGDRGRVGPRHPWGRPRGRRLAHGPRGRQGLGLDDIDLAIQSHPRTGGARDDLQRLRSGDVPQGDRDVPAHLVADGDAQSALLGYGGQDRLHIGIRDVQCDPHGLLVFRHGCAGQKQRARDGNAQADSQYAHSLMPPRPNRPLLL